MALRTAQSTGTMATLAIIAALVGFFVIFTGHPLWGLILELIALPLGVLGLLRAASPRVSGGVISIVAIIAAVLGLILAVLVMVGMLVF